MPSALLPLAFTSRKLFVASRDNIMPEVLGGIHVTHRTPIPAVLCISIFSAVLICVGTIEQIIDAFVATIWVFYGLSLTGILIMRLTEPDRRRPFKIWLIFPALMMVAAVFLIVVPLLQNAVPQLIAFGGTSLGIPIYFIFVMESPWKIRPKIFDKLSGWVAMLVNNVFGTVSNRSSTLSVK